MTKKCHRWKTLGTGGEGCVAHRPHGPWWSRFWNAGRASKLPIAMRLQSKPAELHLNLGLSVPVVSITTKIKSIHCNRYCAFQQMFPFNSLIAHYFSSSLFLHLPFSSEQSLERKHPQSGRSENLIYYLQLPANTGTLDLTKERKIVTHVFTA